MDGPPLDARATPRVKVSLFGALCRPAFVVVRVSFCLTARRGQLAADRFAKRICSFL